MLTSSCPHLCTSTLFMLWDGNQLKKPIHYVYVWPFKKCFFCLKVDGSSAFFQWVKYISFAYIQSLVLAAVAVGNLLLMATEEYLSQMLMVPALQGKLHALPWALVISLALFLFFVFYLTYMFVLRRMQRKLWLNQLQRANLEHAC